MKTRIGFVFTLLVYAAAVWGQDKLPALPDALKAGRDLWGEAAMAQPNGASYEFLAPLLPPPRYVNADFRYYPIPLSAPNAKVKARLISNGSGLNLHGGSRSWNDNGTPIVFRVGQDDFMFGGLRDRLSEPELADGWLPIVTIQYRHPSPVQAEGLVPLKTAPHEAAPEVYRLEAFASTDPALAESGVVFVRFSLAQGNNGYVAIDIDAKSKIAFASGKVKDEAGKVLAAFDKNWKRERGLFTARLKPGATVVLAAATRPLDSTMTLKIDLPEYERQRAACAGTWRQILGGGMNVETPEPLVNNAWRHLVCQNFELINGDRIHYSAGNQYNALYESEGSDAFLAFLTWGFEADARRLLVPLLDFTRKGLEFHQAGFKLNNVCRYYWQTRDAAAVAELRARWEKEARRLDENRTGPHGLYPKEQYCGDIHTFVQSLNASSKAWRALRDLGAMLGQTGADDARRYTQSAGELRKTVLAAIAQSVNRDLDPPFVPVALFGDEAVHDPICATRIGSYWNITIGYTIGSGIFPPGSAEESWIPRYQETRGGLFVGLLRSGGQIFNFWTGSERINPLYGGRYVQDTLRRDDPERALVSFYGMLAQGFTRGTFICGEGCTLDPVDEGGRFFYCPPNSAANAFFLSTLRGLLVQEWDLDDDGKPDTLRLACATPRRWMEDGKRLMIERAPTAFGPVSFKIESHLKSGEVLADLDLPVRNSAKKITFRARVPEGWKVIGARTETEKLNVDETGAVDLSGRKGKLKIVFAVRGH